ncbi:PadR family transcriptional regulator [Dongshaea marina]|uniref:PadR family transcriptional regulator n=1 Tax=Dongshaea marina TaxID=2047966 RepID=UPI000D3E44A0|nr:PadR family transcriptional regulator [Dongshaea marina]
MSRINKTQFAILGYISKHQPMSGYDIKRLLEKVAAFYWSESNSQIYPLLKKLLDQGMVTVEQQDSSRKKNLYRITELGREHLMQWLEEETEPQTFRNELLLKLSLSQHLSDQQTLEQMHYFSEQVTNKRRKLKKIQKHIREDHVGRADQKYLLMTYRYSELMLKAQQQWCEEVERELESGES